MMREGSLINENIEGYSITTKLGSNAFSPAFVGERLSPMGSYQRVIIKLLYILCAQTQQEQQNIQQTISCLQKLRHPHILPILSFDMHKEPPYIITEYMSSGSLYDRLQGQASEQPMRLEEAFLLLVQVGQALHYAHQHQVIHGHLKPQNVLFNRQNEALITDFHRHALLLPDEFDTDSPEASLYQAPEQLEGVTSEKSDQYALGCLAYTLFTGHNAFLVSSPHTPGVFYKMKALIAPRQLNAALPSQIEEAILKAMSREPEQRYADVAAFLAALTFPLALEKRALRETIATLVPMTKEHATNLSPSPTLGRDTQEVTTKLSQETDDYSGKTTQIALERQPSSGGSHKPRSHKVMKSIPTRSQQVMTVIICLLAFMFVLTTLLINGNVLMPSKREGTSWPLQGTSRAQSASQTGTQMAVGTRPAVLQPTAKVRFPSQKATPPQQSTASATPVGTPTSVPTMAPTSVATAAPISVVKAAPTAPPQPFLVPLTSFFNSKAIGKVAGQANFDGSGYAYPASELPASGQISVQGVPYQFVGYQAGANDNIRVSGQTIFLTSGNYSQAFLLVAASWGPTSGTMTITYTDGSTSSQNVTVSDWYHGPGVLNTSYRYSSQGKDNHPVSLYVLSIALDSSRVVNALVLPGEQWGPYQNGHMHVFALTLLA